jgi:hypothetical protein
MNNDNKLRTPDMQPLAHILSDQVGQNLTALVLIWSLFTDKPTNLCYNFFVKETRFLQEILLHLLHNSVGWFSPFFFSELLTCENPTNNGSKVTNGHVYRTDTHRCKSLISPGIMDSALKDVRYGWQIQAAILVIGARRCGLQQIKRRNTAERLAVLTTILSSSPTQPYMKGGSAAL